MDVEESQEIEKVEIINKIDKRGRKRRYGAQIRWHW